ncbi:hypothetical protein G1K46_09360 [Tenacibaculum finnmarkense]|uniref:hypothetical protein n=1 Tax=Tenacibaculum finnmarkense TaxID=2781243 RepID=UPI001EFAC481|nr:hypothetical protein [Tenacibaculum finnmarkense]MCG8762937.1 hypothetical protein [Tenacibaculum finnmarkense]MCG8788434.1 hypothetical protein [Tenacibaculum finnmarkense]
MIWNINAKRWCWNNGIKIFPKPMVSNGSVLKIVISNNGVEKIGKDNYDNKEVYKKINELYTQIYNKK